MSCVLLRSWRRVGDFLFFFFSFFFSFSPLPKGIKRGEAKIVVLVVIKALLKRRKKKKRKEKKRLTPLPPILQATASSCSHPATTEAEPTPPPTKNVSYIHAS